MDIVINGDVHVFDDVSQVTLSEVLDILEVKSEQVVIEHNGVICEANVLKERVVSHGDEIEIVQFVGGG
jgi:sulfur carrier protein